MRNWSCKLTRNEVKTQIDDELLRDTHMFIKKGDLGSWITID